MADVPLGWRRLGFEEVIDFQEGPGIMARDFRSQGVPLIRLAGLTGPGSVLRGCNYLDPTDVERRWSHFRLLSGDTLLSTSASLGRTAVVSDAAGAIAYTGIIRMRPASPSVIMNEILRFLLEGPDFQRQASVAGGGSVMTHFGPSHLRRMTLVVPPLEEQAAIAAVLQAIDDKIESVERIATMCREIVKLEMLASETRWPEQAVSTLATFVNGGAYTNRASGTGRMVIRIAELSRGPGASTVYNDIAVPDDRTARSGDILMAWSGTLGVHVWHGPEAIVNQHIFKVLPKGYPNWLVFDRLECAMPSFRQIAADKATTMGHIKRHHLDDVKVPVPPTAEVAKFNDVLDPLWDRAIAARHEGRTLAEIRGTLLAELLSGRLRMEPARKLVESAAR